MFNNSYSNLCNHRRLQRIDNNFVRCLECGQSMISQKIVASNKTRDDFTRESEFLNRNFNRNFSNEIDQVDEVSNRPVYEYYTDRLGANSIVINKTPVFNSQPLKYEVVINGTKSYLTQSDISKIFFDINAIRVNKN